MANNNGVPLINGQSYSWGDVVCNMGGVPATGITAIEYADDQDIEDHYGAGRYPVARGYGRIKCSAKITLLKGEVEALMSQAPNGRIQQIAPFDIVVAYLPDSGPIVKHVLKNCQFKKNERKLKEGDMKTEVELEMVISHIKWK